jgi:hypothetical protein
MYLGVAVANTYLEDGATSTLQTGLVGKARGVVVSRTIEAQRTTGSTDRDRQNHGAFRSPSRNS